MTSCLIHILLAHSLPAPSRCGGYTCAATCARQPVTIQWARDEREYMGYMTLVHSKYGIEPELRVAPGTGPGVDARWEVMKVLLRQTGAESILDVGGIGTYGQVVHRYRCINVLPRRYCTVYAGSQLQPKLRALAGRDGASPRCAKCDEGLRGDGPCLLALCARLGGHSRRHRVGGCAPGFRAP